MSSRESTCILVGHTQRDVNIQRRVVDVLLDFGLALRKSFADLLNLGVINRIRDLCLKLSFERPLCLEEEVGARIRPRGKLRRVN